MDERRLRCHLAREVAVGRAVEEDALGAELERAGLREAEEKIGEIESSVLERITLVIESAGEESGEAEAAARVGVVERILLEAAIAGAEGQVVPAADHEGEVLGDVG